MVAPEESCLNLQRLAADGLAGRFGLYEAVDYTPARLPRGQTSAVVRSFMAHHQGMILLSLAHVLLARPMQRRFESNPLFKATLLLLQERIPKAAAFYSHPAELSAIRGIAGGPEAPVRVIRSPDTPIPEVQLLSNGRYHVMVTNAGGGSSRWKDLAVTRWREDSTCDNWGTFCYIRDVASGDVLVDRASADGQARGALRSHIHRGARRISPARQRLRIAYRDRRFARGRHRAAPAAHHQPLADAADDRRHELRGSRSRAACRRRAASGVFQSFRADRDHRAAAGHPVHAPAPLARRAAALDVSPHGRPRGRLVGRLLRDGPHGLHRPRTHGRRSAGDDRRRKAFRQSGFGPGSDRRDPAPDDARSAPDGDDRHRIRHRRNARRRIGPRRKVPGSPSRGSRLRSRVDAQLGDAAPDQCHRVRCAALRPPRQFRHLRQCLAARGGRRSDQEPPRAIRAVELRDFRRSADRAAADRRLGEHRPRAPDGAGARVLASEGIGGGPRDLERGPRRISAGPAGSDHGADRRRRRSARDGSARRDLRAAGGADRRRGPHPAPDRGARHHHRPPRNAGGADQPARPRRRCGCRASCRSGARAAKPSPLPCPRGN